MLNYTIGCVRSQDERRVFISKIGNKTFHLCVAEIHIRRLRELTRNKSTYQVSTVTDISSALHGYTTTIDGFNGLRFTQVGNIMLSWGKVDLQEKSIIFASTMINRNSGTM